MKPESSLSWQLHPFSFWDWILSSGRGFMNSETFDTVVLAVEVMISVRLNCSWSRGMDALPSSIFSECEQHLWRERQFLDFNNFFFFCISVLVIREMQNFWHNKLIMDLLIRYNYMCVFLASMERVKSVRFISRMVQRQEKRISLGAQVHERALYNPGTICIKVLCWVKTWGSCPPQVLEQANVPRESSHE